MKSTTKCPPYAIIAAATAGNEMAIGKVLNHYEAYISKASLRPLYDEYGNIYLAVDMELKGRIRTALMKMIMKFEMKIV